MSRFYDFGQIDNPMALENSFRGMTPADEAVPFFRDARKLLPEPVWDGHAPEISCYWKAWELAFQNLTRPTEANGFVANYIGTAFNGCLFLWDSVYALYYGAYGRRAFDFQRTLDNLYCKQHRDGFICREIGEDDGQDRFFKHDPSSTGTHIMPWSEWDHYLLTGDRDRLGRVFPVLVGFHRWLRAWRTWPDGTYWTSGWGAGCDNMPRFKAPIAVDFYHGHMAWVDVCMQMVFACNTLLRMAAVLGRGSEVGDLEEEAARLTRVINDRMWDETTGYYYDLTRDGSRSGVMIIGAYWALLAGIVPPERLARFVAHLDNPLEFNRPHRVPSIAASMPGYQPGGGYWQGGVWIFTNYPLLRGLTACGMDGLAHEIAMNHVGNVTGVFAKTGTIWENYAPEDMAQGEKSLPDFVGAGGITPIAMLFEYIFGLRPYGERLVWDVRLTGRHGVRGYPVRGGAADLICEPRAARIERPSVSVRSNVPLEIELRWNGGACSELIRVPAIGV